MNTKLVKTIREAIALAGLKDGMTISFTIISGTATMC